MRIILGAACVAALISSTTGVSATTDLQGFLPELSAGTIAVISDGEFVAQTYAMGRLAPAGAGLRDRLTILTIEDGTVRTASLNVSNSVTAAPEVIALTPDGAAVYVADALYDDVSIEIDFEAGTPPVLLLGDTPAPCGFPTRGPGRRRSAGTGRRRPAGSPV